MKPVIRTTPNVLTAAIFVAIILTVPALAGVEKVVTKNFEVSPGGELFVETDLGSIEIFTSDVHAVDIEIVLEARTSNEKRAHEYFDEFDIQFDASGNIVEIVAEYDDDRGDRWRRGRADFKANFYITVPREFDVTLLTAGGSVAVGDLVGNVRATTSGGSLLFEKIDGSIRGQTSGGNIAVKTCSGQVDVTTSGGSIGIGSVGGDVHAATSGGSIVVEEAFGLVDASTSGGSVMARLAEQPRGDCRLSTSGGNVTVYLKEGINVNLDASTSGGKVYTDFPIKVQGQLTGSSIRASLNQGGPEMRLRTSGGNIEIKAL